MEIDPTQIEVVHNTNESRFEVTIGEYLAVMEYMMGGKTMIFTHTGVPSEIEGQGVAESMARVALEYAKDSGFRVKPICPFVRAYIKRHKEYHDITRGL